MANQMLIIDVSSFIHRAFHAVPSRLNSNHREVGALYTSVKMLRNIVNKVKPQFVVSVFDHPKPCFRHEIYSGYKANRPEKPAELLDQIAELQVYAGAMGINPISVPNVEADDVIASIARSSNQSTISTLIATQDKDLAAVVTDYVNLIDKNGFITGVQEVIDLYGVRPEQITDYLTLVGDKSDSIPGVDGCGPVKASTLLQEYGTLEAVIDNYQSIKGVLGKKIVELKDQLFAMREIVELQSELRIETGHKAFKRRAANVEILLDLFQKHEFDDLSDRLKHRVAS